MAAPLPSSSDFVIWGPSVDSDLVMNVVRALRYLPPQYKLVLPTASSEEQDAYGKVVSLIRHDGLDGRVQFTNKQVEADHHAVIASNVSGGHAGHVFGQTPKALATAILNVGRVTA
jgi:hypothetical protein